MFPLERVLLFPEQLMPLQIFEPRYLQMVEDSLDTGGRIVMATVRTRDRAGLPDCPPVVPIAGVGEIAKYERTSENRIAILLAGIERVQIEEVESDKLYRKVLCTPIEEALATDEDDAQLRPGLLEAILTRTQSDLSIHQNIPLSTLANILAQCTTAPEDVMLAIHGEFDLATRVRLTLRAQEQFGSK